MKRKYFFFDIDGTLLVNDGFGGGTVPDSAKEALRLLRENGHFLAIATGRAYCLAKDYLDELGFDNMVSDGGNGITLNGELQGVIPLDKGLMCELIAECREKGFPWGIQTTLDAVRQVPDDSFSRFTGDRYMLDEIIPDMNPADFEKIYKAFVACEYPRARELETLKKLPWCRYGNGSRYIFVEPLNKAFGIRKMLEAVGGDPADVVVFGDQKNDLSMFCPEWTSVAMGNAVDELKAVADYVTTDCDKDGIWNACRHFGWV